MLNCEAKAACKAIDYAGDNANCLSKLSALELVANWPPRMMRSSTRVQCSRSRPGSITGTMPNSLLMSSSPLISFECTVQVNQWYNHFWPPCSPLIDHWDDTFDLNWVQTDQPLHFNSPLKECNFVFLRIFELNFFSPTLIFSYL